MDLDRTYLTRTNSRQTRGTRQWTTSLKYDVLTAVGAWGCGGDKHRQKLVLRLITLLTARYNWQDDTLVTGQREIASLWSVDPRTVKREMAKMRDLGWLILKRPAARGRVACYGLGLDVILRETRDGMAECRAGFRGTHVRPRRREPRPDRRRLSDHGGRDLARDRVAFAGGRSGAFQRLVCAAGAVGRTRRRASTEGAITISRLVRANAPPWPIAGGGGPSGGGDRTRDLSGTRQPDQQVPQRGSGLGTAPCRRKGRIGKVRRAEHDPPPPMHDKQSKHRIRP